VERGTILFHNFIGLFSRSINSVSSISLDTPIAHSSKPALDTSKISDSRPGWWVIIPIMAALALVACQGDDSRGWSPVAVGEVARGDDSSITVVFVGTSDGEILALDSGALKDATIGVGQFSREKVESCCLLWHFLPPSDSNSSGLLGPAVVGNELLFVSINDPKNGNSVLYALRKDTGEEEWSAPIAGDVFGGLALTPDQGLVLVGSDAGAFYAFNASIGEPGEPQLLWKFPEEQDKFIGGIWSTPASDDQRVYFGSMDHKVYALSLKDGTLHPGWPFETNGAVTGKPLILGGEIIIGSFDQKLYTINAETGSGRSLIQAENWFWAGAVTDGSSVYAPSIDGEIHLLDNHGNPIGSFHTNQVVVSRPIVLEEGSESYVVVATEDGGLYLLRDGAQVCPSRIGSGVDNVEDLLLTPRVKAPLVGVGEIIFLGTDEAVVWGIEINERRCLEKLWRVDI
jgi:outer membrane protein assembly factor BamB